MRPLFRWLVALTLVGAAVFWWITRPQIATAEVLAGVRPDLAQGEQVFNAGGCASCHAAPKTEGEARAEVCVIGGGYAGLSAALHLAEAGRELVVGEEPGAGQVPALELLPGAHVEQQEVRAGFDECLELVGPHRGGGLRPAAARLAPAPGQGEREGQGEHRNAAPSEPDRLRPSRRTRPAQPPLQSDLLPPRDGSRPAPRPRAGSGAIPV